MSDEVNSLILFRNYGEISPDAPLIPDGLFGLYFLNGVLQVRTLDNQAQPIGAIGLSGEATGSVQPDGTIATTLDNDSVLAKTLSSFSPINANVSVGDSITTALEKLQGKINAGGGVTTLGNTGSLAPSVLGKAGVISGNTLALTVAWGYTDTSGGTGQFAGICDGIVTHLAQSFSGLKTFPPGIQLGVGSTQSTQAKVLMILDSGASSYTLRVPPNPQPYTYWRREATNSNSSWSGSSTYSTSGDTNVAIAAGINIHGVTALTTGRTKTLPAANAMPAGFMLTVKDEAGQAATNNISVAPAGANTIDGSATPLVINTNYGSVKLYTNGTNWFTR